MVIRTVIFTISDRCFAGERKNDSGPLIEELLPADIYTVVERKILPDDPDTIKGALMHYVSRGDVDLILTTGGTGFGERDVTPEATAMVIQKRTQGLDFLLYSYGVESNPYAVLSRAVSGIRNKTLIINLPGHPRAVKTCLEVLIPILPHALNVMKGAVTDGEHTHKEIKNN
jgi:molybdenum cofactor synthesis domain-containing protein